MNRVLILAAATVAPLLANGCQTASSALSVQRQPLTIEQQAALSISTDYQTALRTISARGKTANTGTNSTRSDAFTTGSVETDSALALPPAPANNSFGPRIGQYFLADDYVVYRHARPQANFVASSTIPTESVAIAPQAKRVDLTYFLVSPEGIIEDYAYGLLEVAQTSCLQIISGQVIICDQPDKLSTDFELFDWAVRTQDGATLSSWNVSANAAEAQSIDPFALDEAGTAPAL